MTAYMKAMGISRYHQDELETFTVPVPAISDDEVLVQVHAASVNPVDFKIRDACSGCSSTTACPSCWGSTSPARWRRSAVP